jgi:hypothetical protein
MFLHWLHVGLAAFIVCGWVFAPRLHGPVAAAVLGHWLTNGGRCVLSGDYEDENGFTRSLIEGLGLPWPSTAWIQSAIPYALLLVPLSLSIWLTKGLKGGAQEPLENE